MPNSPADAATGAAFLQRLRFVAQSAAGDVVLAEFSEPYPRRAVAEIRPLAELTATPPVAAVADEFRVLQLAKGAEGEAEWQKWAEAWMAPREPGDAGAPVRVTFDGGWLLWRPGRAACLAAPERREELAAALVEFAFHEGELRRLEQELSGFWEQAGTDARLAHAVRAEDLPLRAAIGETSRRVVEWRIRAARLESRLLRPGPALTPAGRRAGETLREKAELEERLETLDGQLEVYEYIYEGVNQRLSDYVTARREYIVELAIVVLLAAETVFVVAELFLSWWMTP